MHAIPEEVPAGSAGLKRRKIGVERKHSHGSRKCGEDG